MQIRWNQHSSQGGKFAICGEEQAAAGRDRGDDEAGPELVSPEQSPDAVERSPEADEREQADEEHHRHEHLPDDTEDGQDDGDVVRDRGDDHRAAGYPPPAAGGTLRSPGWRNWSDAPDLKSGGPRAVRVQVPPPAFA